MLTLTLIENRTTPPLFAVHVTYERKGDKLQRLEKRYRATNGKWVCTGSKVIPFSANKDWTGVHTGQKGSHGRPFTAKRDWLHLHSELAYARQEASNA